MEKQRSNGVSVKSYFSVRFYLPLQTICAANSELPAYLQLQVFSHLLGLFRQSTLHCNYPVFSVLIAWICNFSKNCFPVTPLRTGAKHRKSRLPCWWVVPMRTWLILTVTWMIWGTTGPTLLLTSPSWICAKTFSREYPWHTHARTHTPVNNYIAANSACTLLLV